MTDTERIATQKVWSVGEMQRRLGNLRALMDEKSLDAVILTSLHNVLYYTGFFCPPFGRLHSAVVPRNGEPALIVSLIEDERPRHCCYLEDIRLFHDWEMSPLENNVRLFGEVLRDNGIHSGRLGYEEDSVSVSFKAMIDRALARKSQTVAASGLRIWENAFYNKGLSRTGGVPRCPHTVTRICSVLHPSRTVPWSPRSMAGR